MRKSKKDSNINRGEEFNFIIPGSNNFDIFIHDQKIKDEERIDFRVIVDRKRVINKGFFIDVNKQWDAYFDVCKRIDKSIKAKRKKSKKK